jgi:hypothetical protein
MAATKLEILRDRLAWRPTYKSADEISVALAVVAALADWLDVETDGFSRASRRGGQPSLRDVLQRALGRAEYVQAQTIVFGCRTPDEGTGTDGNKANGK